MTLFDVAVAIIVAIVVASFILDGMFLYQMNKSLRERKAARNEAP